MLLESRWQADLIDITRKCMIHTTRFKELEGKALVRMRRVAWGTPVPTSYIEWYHITRSVLCIHTPMLNSCY